MCLAVLALDQTRRFPFVLCVNRDEFFSRNTARLAWWRPDEQGPEILGGRDLDQGGTWLGLTTPGRLGLVTNIRSRATPDPQAPSRGHILTQWLHEEPPIDKFWTRVAMSGYNGFNLIIADFVKGDCFWGSSLHAMPKRLERGLYGLSNASLDTPWPKTIALKQQLANCLKEASNADALARQMFEALGDKTLYPEEQCPHTGLARELEHQLSAAFVSFPDGSYGTRCSTLIITERVNKRLLTHVFERTYAPRTGVALMRKVTLKNWPPRHTEGIAPSAVEASAVAEGNFDAASAPPPVKRKRARGVIRSLPKSRRRNTGFGDLG